MTFIFHRSKLQNNVHPVFASEIFGLTNRIQSSFMFISGDVEKRFVLCVAKSAAAFFQNTQTDSSVTKYVFLQYI